MPGVAKRTFSLSQEQAKFIDAKVQSGGYASGSEVVRDALRVLQIRDAAFDRWLAEEVGPTYDAHMADPSAAMPIEQAFAELKQEIDDEFGNANG